MTSTPSTMSPFTSSRTVAAVVVVPIRLVVTAAVNLGIVLGEGSLAAVSIRAAAIGETVPNT